MGNLRSLEGIDGSGSLEGIDGSGMRVAKTSNADNNIYAKHIKFMAKIQSRRGRKRPWAGPRCSLSLICYVFLFYILFFSS